MTKSVSKLNRVPDWCPSESSAKGDGLALRPPSRRSIRTSVSRRRELRSRFEHPLGHCREPEFEERILRKISRAIQAQKSQVEPSANTDRRYGPALLISRIFETWGLERSEAATLLGFERSDHPSVTNILGGYGPIDRRDTRDRIAYLIQIRNILYALFRDDKVENEWLRETHVLLGNHAPLDLLLEGSMENLLLVKEYCYEVGGM